MRAAAQPWLQRERWRKKIARVKERRPPDRRERERDCARERERERALSERQLGRHSSRLSRTSLCDFYTRSDFLAARLALARQIYVPRPYKSRAYKDIEAKANENSSSHPLSFCLPLFPLRPRSSPSRATVPHHPLFHHTWRTPLLSRLPPFP